MKSLLILFQIIIFSVPILAQENSVERDFTKNVKRLTLEKYSEGEDATSGFDYLIYKDKAELRKIRIIWNGGASSPPTVEDIYYKAGVPVLYARLALTKRQFKSVVKGSRIALPVIEKLYLKEAKLMVWIENGKSVTATDPRWSEKEKTVLEQAKDLLEYYSLLKGEQ